MQKIVNNNPPPAVKGKHLKIIYSAQTRHSPPIFAIFMNYPDLVPISYKRYIENQLRNELDLEGVPVKISFRKKTITAKNEPICKLTFSIKSSLLKFINFEKRMI